MAAVPVQKSRPAARIPVWTSRSRPVSLFPEVARAKSRGVLGGKPEQHKRAAPDRRADEVPDGEGRYRFFFADFLAFFFVDFLAVFLAAIVNGSSV